MSVPTNICCFLECAKPAMPNATKCASHKNKIKCSIEGCMNQVYARYLCVRHGGKKQCQTPGCHEFARGGPNCVTHGGVIVKRFCTEPGCSRQAHARYKCVRHGGGRTCREKDCDLHARSSGFCHRHTQRKARDVIKEEPQADNGGFTSFLDSTLLETIAWSQTSSVSTTTDESLDHSILSLLCDSLASPKAQACLAVPSPVKVSATLLFEQAI